MIARLHGVEVAVLVMFAGALTAGSPMPAFTVSDTTPPILRVQQGPSWAACRDYGPVFPRLIAYADDDQGVDAVTWSTGSGDGGLSTLVCPSRGFTGDCYWEARQIPLLAGPNTIIVTARDAAGNTASQELEVTGRASTSILHVDCTQPVADDGSATSPSNDLGAAVSATCPGDTIQIDGGPCATDFTLLHGLKIQGNPALPAAQLETGRADSYTAEPVEWRHLSGITTGLRKVEIHGSVYTFGPSETLVEDVRDVAIITSSPLPRYTVRGADGIFLWGGDGGTGMLADIAASTRVAISSDFSGGQATIRVADSQVTTLAMTNHGYWDVLIERSTIEAGSAAMRQYGEGGCCELGLTIRDSLIRDTQLSVERTTYCPWGSCTPFTRPAVLLERNRFVNSTFTLRETNQAAQAAPATADLVVQNNLMDHSGLQIGLTQETPTAVLRSGFLALIRHNTMIDAPTAVEVSASMTGQRRRQDPPWRAEIANNIIVGSGTGVRVAGNAPYLVVARIRGNDFFRNASDIVVDQPVAMEANLFRDPRFQLPFPWDRSLRPNSPCIDAGVDVTGPPPFDFLGTVRSLDGNKDGIARPDIGALEFVPRRLNHRAPPAAAEP